MGATPSTTLVEATGKLYGTCVDQLSIICHMCFQRASEQAAEERDSGYPT